jgi:hypothetical protein
MKPYIFVSRSSASLTCGKYKVYYGEGEIDELTGDWCLVIWKNDKEVARYTNSQLLDFSCGESPESLVIAGLAQYLSGK